MVGMMKEVWKSIPGYPGYRVSNRGRVKSIRWSEERILETKNRLRFVIPKTSRVASYTVASLMLRAFVRQPRRGEVARHLDDDTSNNVLLNLAWGTRRDNAQDAIRNGRFDLKKRSRNTKRSWKIGVYAHMDYSANALKGWKKVDREAFRKMCKVRKYDYRANALKGWKKVDRKALGEARKMISKTRTRNALGQWA